MGLGASDIMSPSGALPSKPVSGGGWSPPRTRLPGPQEHLVLLARLARAAARDVWAAESARWPGVPLIVEFLPEPVLAGAEAASPGRQVLDLRPWTAAGWPPTALVTTLPAPLPGPYARFQLLSFIGLGGMGQAWMAEAPDYPDIPLAIKFLTHPVYRQHPTLLEQCLQEAKVGISIDSPFIARTYQLLDLRAYQGSGWPPLALVMRLYEPSLQRVLDELQANGQRLSQPVAVELARNLLDGLEALHSGHGLVHRDIKPSNVLLRVPEDGAYRGPESLEGATALLADLGTLCRIGQRPLFALGQDGWKAPELFAPAGSTTPDGERSADPAEDLYAFGLVLRSLAAVVEAEDQAPSSTGTRVLHTVDRPGVNWLHLLANELTDQDPGRRLAARVGLRSRLSPQEAGRAGSFPLPQVSQYEVLGRIGYGGMGEVYKARHRRLHRLVALKIFRWQELRGDLLERFRTEALAIARLNHPHIVQIYEVGDVDGRPFLALEYCAGGNLAAQLHGSGPWPPRQAARLVLHLAQAMQFAHEHHVIHRDLKPSNVLLAEDGTPKVADFGLARLLDAEERLTLSGAVMGTPAYMAPEQAQGDPRAIGPWTDVYGLGVVLYELLTGRPPFGHGTRLETLLQIVEAEPKAPSLLVPEVPSLLERACLRCLRKRPQQRYVSAAALAEELSHFLAEETALPWVDSSLRQIERSAAAFLLQAPEEQESLARERTENWRGAWPNVEEKTLSVSEQLERELCQARRLQQQLLPESPPRLPGFDIAGGSLPAREVGGDYFDFVPLNDGSVAIALGDASGHGLTAALRIAETRAYLRALALTSNDLSTLLSGTNHYFALTAGDAFITLFLARLDPNQRCLVYASAGHPSGYLLDRDGNVKLRLSSTGMPLGIVADQQFPAVPPLRLQPGDLVLLLTDGILEALSEDTDTFGEQRTLEVVRAHRTRPARDIVAALHRAVLDFAQDRAADDDRTAVVIKAVEDR